MLKIQFKDKRQEPFWVMEKTFSIGKASKNNLTLEDPTVSPQHAKIHNQGETFLIKDLGSENGTFVNGQRVTQKQIACGDKITLGSIELEVIDPIEEQGDSNYWSLIADSSWLSGQEFPIIGNPEDVVSIGRSSQCNIVFAGTHLSRLHAEITINYSSLTIKDMGSANGTFVNDKKVKTTQLYPGDRVRFDVYSFRVFGPGIALPKSATTASHKVVLPENLDKALTEKRYKSKPTSPGNREELNLYKKHHHQIVIAGMILAGVLVGIGYVAYAILGSS